MSALILVVDDDARNVRLLSSLLHGAGYEVASAPGGKEACAVIEHEAPDLVLLDAMMPAMNGFDVCAWIRSRQDTRLLPVVMVTALNSTEEKVRALEIGADDFLSKPINRLELMAKVRSLLRVKGLQEDLARKNEELRQAEALRETLVQMIVHDLKNPLTGIQGHTDLLLAAPGVPERARHIAGAIHGSCRTMLAMILDLLDIGRMEEGHDIVTPAPCDLAPLMAECLEECAGFARAAGVELSLDVPASGPAASADPAVLRRVLANLLNNAVKHTPPGGRVTLSARPGPEGIEVSVSDTGEGIPEEEQGRIFDKFARASRQTRGTRSDRGLGLTFCRMAVEAHGGRIRVASTVGEGSRFFFTLPALPAAPAGEAPAPSGLTASPLEAMA
ncbi:MAG TPA: hybrid sensor histidine kinase/response regulator [Candidatus Polarisedimenticolia bacterium]|nr:hybrid sensor histidine kinase/response regulator [Candidatus Polarisedimenticolia bacterium]